MLEQKDYKNLYKEIVTNLLEGVMVISMNGKIAMLNPAAEHMLGITQDDIGDSFINVFLTREGTDDFNEAILDTVYEKEKVSNKPIDYMLEGEIRNLSLTTSYIHNDGEKSVVVVIEDVTELNELRDAQTALNKISELNREYEKAKDEAIRANEAKSLFLSNMSHEIRTPINAVLGMNEMILRECSDKQLLSYAANIQSSGKTLLFLINDILDMSKIESGKMEIVRVEYEPENLIMDLWNVIFLRAQEKGLDISFTLDETLPRIMFGDDVRIKQIVTNLLTNAVKYTPQGGIAMHVAYERRGEGQIALIISVKDTGMGIRKEDMGKLFESFQRLDEEKNRNIEGTGLGMNITMSLLKLMDGEMKVESEYGQGSEFTVTIPQRIVCDEPVGNFEAIRKRREQNLAQKQQTFEAPEASVLVVDDNSMNLTVFKSLLKRTKMRITTADSGSRCLELVQKERYHIIFMDHMMPEMDGIETLHEIRKLSDSPNIDTPVIVLTANALSGAKELVIRAKADRRQSKGESVKTDHEKYLQYGIFIENGLSHAKGDAEMYLELVRMFIREREKQEELNRFRSEQNMKDYAIWVHGLKGNARTLGAEQLADIAFEHEKQSKADNVEYVNRHFAQLLEIWESTLEGFEKYVEEQGGDEDDCYGAADGIAGETLQLSESDFEKAAAYLEEFETDRAIAQLREWIAVPLERSMHDYIKNILIALEDEFDEDKAIELLKNGRK